MKGYQQQFMMDLRVAINHPYVGHFGLTSHISKGPQYHIYEHMGQDVIDCCGKMQVLHQVMAALLPSPGFLVRALQVRAETVELES